MIELSQSEVAAYYRQRVPNLRQSGKEPRTKCPVHGGDDPNFAVSLETGQATCFSLCQRGYDIFSLEQALSSCDFATAKRQVFSLIGRKEPEWEDRDVEASYDYRDADGKLIYQVVRKSGKKFMQRRPNADGGWTWGLGGTAPVPFRLPEVKAVPFVAITEGEKDALGLVRIGMQATCNNGGAGNFKPELVPWFAGKAVAIFPDNDDPGRQHALKVAALLSGTAKSIKIVELPGVPVKGDVSDYLANGGTIALLRGLYSRAQEWTPEWEFSSDIPDENDKYVRTFLEEVKHAGSLDNFWDFRFKSGVQTPWRDLTRDLGGGMRAGEVYVIGANQGTGKTSLALQFATKALQNKQGVLLYSMEMGHRDVFQRIIAMEARVDLLQYQELQRGGAATAMIASQLQIAGNELLQHQLLVSTKTRVTPDYLVSETARLKKRQPIHLVIVDHMQLMAATGGIRGDYEKFTAISRAMKETAREMDVPVLLVSQTSRANSSDKRSELEVSDLRGSGAIEEDAAAVMLLYPDREDMAQQLLANTFAQGPVKTWLKIGKNRYGRSGKYIPLMHFKQCTRFDRMEGEREQ